MTTIPYPEAALSVTVPLPQPYTIEHEARLVVWLSKQTTGSILEIGCANGFLTRALAEANPERTVYALDWSYNPALSEHQQAERPDIVASRAIHLSNVIAINGDSKRFDYPPGIGFIFVDGDHTPPGVEADTVKSLNYRHTEWNLFNRNVIVAWHDYRPESQWQGVAALLNRISKDYVLRLIEGTPIVTLGWPCE